MSETVYVAVDYDFDDYTIECEKGFRSEEHAAKYAQVHDLDVRAVQIQDHDPGEVYEYSEVEFTSRARVHVKINDQMHHTGWSEPYIEHRRKFSFDHTRSTMLQIDLAAMDNYFSVTVRGRDEQACRARARQEWDLFLKSRLEGES